MTWCTRRPRWDERPSRQAGHSVLCTLGSRSCNHHLRLRAPRIRGGVGIFRRNGCTSVPQTSNSGFFWIVFPVDRHLKISVDPPIFDSASTQRLLDCLRDEGLPHGREDSFKLSEGVLIANRVMLGVRTRDASADGLHRISRKVGMPASFAPTFAQFLPKANVVLFATEEGPTECTFKVYLEFWDHVREAVLRTGSREPRLLYLGFKWRAGESSGRVARYTCFPLLNTGECLHRLAALYPAGADLQARRLANDLVVACATRRPAASFVYVEVAEEGTPRISFDINLYKAEVPLHELESWLRRACLHFMAPKAEIETLVERVGSRLLGHLSGGVDRHGRGFLTVYYEIEPLQPHH